MTSICKLLPILIILSLGLACKPKINIHKTVITSLDDIVSLPVEKGYQRPCGESKNYVPDEFSEQRTLRLNVHFMNNSARDANYDLDTGRKFVKEVIVNGLSLIHI